MAAANQAPSADTTAPIGRVDRRKARTRRAMVDAAVRLISEGRGERATVQEITDEADIGFGSFYNHFESKEQLFATAAGQMLEQWGQLMDRATAGIDDPAEVFATSLRMSGRLGWTHPELARFLSGAGLETLRRPDGLAPRALRDIQHAQAAGRFAPSSAEVGLSAVAGGLIELLRLRIERPESVTEEAVDDLAHGMLRFFGLSDEEAATIVAKPLPSNDDA